MGCAAAIPALRQAAHITDSQPHAVVLVVSVELCSLHIRSSSDPEQIVASSVFADGAASAVVTADSGRGRSGGLALGRFATALTDEGEADMVWTIGDHGFEMKLSAEVPASSAARFAPPSLAWSARRTRPTRGRCTPAAAASWTASRRGSSSAPKHWTPPARCFATTGTCPARPSCSFSGGSWSSPPSAPIAALAFGPGLTVESALLHPVS